MKICKLFLSLFFVGTQFVQVLCVAEEAGKPCRKRNLGHDSFVCVCSAEYCDSPDPPGDVSGHKMVYYVSDKLAHRLAKFENAENDDANRQNANNEFEVRVDASQKRQTIFGFGGAFTDAAGVNLNALSGRTRDALLKAYFDQKIGIGYTVGRVPIASCDFSTREYSYLDTPDDFNMTTFALANEDFEEKIPYILKAGQLVGKDRLRMFASPWSPPGWMKTNEQMSKDGQLKGTVDGPYYLLYAQYLKRFFEEYAKQNNIFDAIHALNCSWQSLWLPSKIQRDFASQILAPMLKTSAQTEQLKIIAHDDQRDILLESAEKLFSDQNGLNAIDGLGVHCKIQRDFASQILAPMLKTSAQTEQLKIIAHDDQRDILLESAEKLFSDQNGLNAIDGLGVHWYKHSSFAALTLTHNLYPDKFLLATEACHGDSPWEHRPLLGDWLRGWAYGHDILNNLRNWVVGWTDWNLCLDLKGGPNWVGNLVDAPIIVNATSDEFYKQPMFYFLAHFSRFVPPNSVVLSTSLFTSNGTQLEDNPIENVYSNS
uniref:Glucosylceramidase n=1 Tax=Globodera pallida TaxID=36090 RepID=A0A183BR57_GLOPA